MRVLTRTPAVDPRSHAGQRQVAGARTCSAAATAGGGRGSRPQQATVRREWATRDVAASHVRGVRAHDEIATLAAIVGDDVTAAVPMINGRGDLVGVPLALAQAGRQLCPSVATTHVVPCRAAHPGDEPSAPRTQGWSVRTQPSNV